MDTAIEKVILARAKNTSNGKIKNEFSGINISLANTPIPIIIA